jgi:hypothetical protein
VQSPTTKREGILRRWSGSSRSARHALGSGLVISLDTAMPARIDVDGFINPSKDRPSRSTDEGRRSEG